MPKIPQYQKLYNQLKQAHKQGHITLGDIQAGVKHTQYRTDRKGNIYTVEKRVKPTRIPAFVVKKFFDGTWNPKPATMKKLANYYRRHTRSKLREVGVSTQSIKASDLDRAPIKQVIEQRNTFLDYAEKISRNKGVPLEYIIRGMLHSARQTDNEWDEYIKAKKYI